MTAFDPYLRQSVRGAEEPLRDAGPVVWSEDAHAWIVTRFEDVSRVLRDRRFEAFNLHQAFRRIVERAGLSMPHLEQFLRSSLIFVAGADHLPLRRLLGRALNNRALSELAPMMSEIAERLWSDCVQQGHCDVVRDYSEQFPSLVIARVLGLDEPDRRAFYEATYGLMGVYNRGCSIALYREFDERLRALDPIIDRLFSRASIGDDGLSRLVDEASILGLPREVAAASLIFLYLAAVDQTSAMITLAVRRIALERDLLAAMRSRALDAAALVEELLRVYSPAPQAIRIAGSDTKIGRVDIFAGDMLILLLSAANHDASRHADPQSIRMGRKRHIAFSEGAHSCVGAAFARVELAAALMPVVERPPRSIDTADPVWWPLDATRRIKSLRVSF